MSCKSRGTSPIESRNPQHLLPRSEYLPPLQDRESVSRLVARRSMAGVRSKRMDRLLGSHTQERHPRPFFRYPFSFPRAAVGYLGRVRHSNRALLDLQPSRLPGHRVYWNWAGHERELLSPVARRSHWGRGLSWSSSDRDRAHEVRQPSSQLRVHRGRAAAVVRCHRVMNLPAWRYEPLVIRRGVASLGLIRSMRRTGG